MALAVLLPFLGFAGIKDKVLRFSTPGIDRYADGSVVVDGECYALVWSPAGQTFAGFNADGTPASSSDRVVLAAPLAKGGKCRDALFQIPAAEYDELEGGEWSVCLVDTRTVYGVPSGAKDGRPLRVNRWGLVAGGVNVEDASEMAAGTAQGTARLLAAAGAAPKSGVRAARLSSVPDSLKPPRITSVDVGDGEVVLAVEDTVPYLSYTIVSGAEPGKLRTDYFSETVDGETGAEIAIGTVKTANRRFFRVVRAE